ncbi:MAG TPA: terminase small subunit [Pseudolabrys sp.]
MGILTNPRHELFAQELAKGKSATEAYAGAGYKPCRQNAARLTTNDDIRARLAEIQAQAAKKSEVTVQSLLDELEHARARADTWISLVKPLKPSPKKPRSAAF